MLALAFLGGCDAATSPGEGGHSGHVIPAHKPRTFPEAVESLKSLDGAITAAGGADTPEDERLEQAIDVAGWLPELATESDMPEGPWSEVDRLASALVYEYRSIRSLRDRGPGAPMTARHLAALTQIVATSEPGWFDPPAKTAAPAPDSPAGEEGAPASAARGGAR